MGFMFFRSLATIVFLYLLVRQIKNPFKRSFTRESHHYFNGLCACVFQGPCNNGFLQLVGIKKKNIKRSSAREKP